MRGRGRKQQETEEPNHEEPVFSVPIFTKQRKYICPKNRILYAISSAYSVIPNKAILLWRITDPAPAAKNFTFGVSVIESNHLCQVSSK